jgi:hypothetical protein
MEQLAIIPPKIAFIASHWTRVCPGDPLELFAVALAVVGVD